MKQERGVTVIKSFNELYKVEVPITKKPTFAYNRATAKLEKAGEVDTLSWVDCLDCLYKNGAEKVIFENIPNANGGLLYKDENNAISIKIFVEIDGDRREIFYPVIDGMKDVSIEKVTQTDIYNAKQRSFVKCVAVNWGLGLKLWQKEITPDDTTKEEKKQSEIFRDLVNNAVKKCGGVKEMLKHLTNVDEKRIKTLIEEAKEIDGISQILSKVLNDKQ